VQDVLVREPYNREALYVQAQLDIARGRPSQAALKYESALRLYGEDRRVLLSLAMVLGTLGEDAQARQYADRAKAAYATSESVADWKVYY
jgi:Flp pilus assembly protein TadD